MSTEVYIKRYIEAEKKRLSMLGKGLSNEFFDVCNKAHHYEKKLIERIGMNAFIEINNNI